MSRVKPPGVVFFYLGALYGAALVAFFTVDFMWWAGFLMIPVTLVGMRLDARPNDKGKTGYPPGWAEAWDSKEDAVYDK